MLKHIICTVGPGDLMHVCSYSYPPVDEPLLLCTRTKEARVSKMPILGELTYLLEQSFLSERAWLYANGTQ